MKNILNVTFNVKVGTQYCGFIGGFDGGVETVDYKLNMSLKKSEYIDCDEVEQLVNFEMSNKASVVDGDSSFDKDYFSLLLEDGCTYYQVTILDIK